MASFGFQAKLMIHLKITGLTFEFCNNRGNRHYQIHHKHNMHFRKTQVF